MAALGGLGLAAGQRSMERALRDLPEALKPIVDERLGRLNRAVVVIAVAVAIYLEARQFGHGRAGLYVCVALLVMNAAVVAALRVRWIAGLAVSPEIAARHRHGALVQMAGSWVLFAGCALYLLRP
jgi:hypothetical protein